MKQYDTVSISYYLNLLKKTFHHITICTDMLWPIDYYIEQIIDYAIFFSYDRDSHMNTHIHRHMYYFYEHNTVVLKGTVFFCNKESKILCWHNCHYDFQYLDKTYFKLIKDMFRILYIHNIVKNDFMSYNISRFLY